MRSKAHLFVVDNYTMPIHIQKGFCGIVKVNRLNKSGKLNNSYFGQIADSMNIKIADLVYFYMQTKKIIIDIDNNNDFEKLEQGYYGIFRVVDNPFYSKENQNYQKINRLYKKIFNRNITLLCIRIPIEPIEDYYIFFMNRVVDDNQAYVDKSDEGFLSTLLFKKIKRLGEERSITPILPEEASKISRLIFKQKYKNFPLKIDKNNLHRYSSLDKYIKLDIEIDDKNEVKRENMLEAYILNALNNNIDMGILSKIIGDLDEIEYCGNQVQYGISGNKVDILLLHKKTIGGSISYRYKATVIELKKGIIDKTSIEQIIDYEKWIAQLVTYNNISAIQPILIGKKPKNMKASTRKLIENNLEKITQTGVKTPIFVEYLPKNNYLINFHEFKVRDIL